MMWLTVIRNLSTGFSGLGNCMHGFLLFMYLCVFEAIIYPLVDSDPSDLVVL